VLVYFKFPRFADEQRLLASYAAEDAGEAVRPDARKAKSLETAA
jgi:hypothetical protein